MIRGYVHVERFESFMWFDLAVERDNRNLDNLVVTGNEACRLGVDTYKQVTVVVNQRIRYHDHLPRRSRLHSVLAFVQVTC